MENKEIANQILEAGNITLQLQSLWNPEMIDKVYWLLLLYTIEQNPMAIPEKESYMKEVLCIAPTEKIK